MEKRKAYMSNYYINKRNYILSLSNKSRLDLSEKEKIDLEKYCDKFRPRTGKAMKHSAGPFYKGKKVNGLVKLRKSVLVSFN